MHRINAMQQRYRPNRQRRAPSNIDATSKTEASPPAVPRSSPRDDRTGSENRSCLDFYSCFFCRAFNLEPDRTSIKSTVLCESGCVRQKSLSSNEKCILMSYRYYTAQMWAEANRRLASCNKSSPAYYYSSAQSLLKIHRLQQNGSFAGSSRASSLSRDKLTFLNTYSNRSIRSRDKQKRCVVEMISNVNERPANRASDPRRALHQTIFIPSLFRRVLSIRSNTVGDKSPSAPLMRTDPPMLASAAAHASAASMISSRRRKHPPPPRCFPRHDTTLSFRNQLRLPSGGSPSRVRQKTENACPILAHHHYTHIPRLPASADPTPMRFPSAHVKSRALCRRSAVRDRQSLVSRL